MEKSWYNHYVGRLCDSYADHFRRKYWPFLELIIQNSSPSDRFLEAGCGIGSVTRALIDLGVGESHHLVDVCPKMIELTRLNLEGRRCFRTYKHDIRALTAYQLTNVIHSHGVLEHFSDEDIQKIIRHQLSFARTLIHYVPSAKYEKPSFGDERLLTPDQWREICAPTEIVEFNDGYDLPLIWRY